MGLKQEENPDNAQDSSSSRLLMAIMALAVFVSVLNNTMVIVAIPLMSQDLDIPGGQTGWIVTGYSLVFAVGIPIYGRISDFYNLRQTFSLALVVFAAGSLICALAPGFAVLIIGRALQAAGSAAIPALAFASVAKIFSPGGRGTAFGILSSSVGVGAAAGPIFGGLGISIGGWRVLFYGTFFLVVILFLAALYELPHTDSEAPESGAVRSLDLPGGLLLAATAGLALFGITRPGRARPRPPAPPPRLGTRRWSRRRKLAGSGARPAPRPALPRPRSPAAASRAPRPAPCRGGPAPPPARQSRRWRSKPPARGRTARRRPLPGSPRPPGGGRGSPSCFAPGNVPVQAMRSWKRLSHGTAARRPSFEGP